MNPSIQIKDRKIGLDYPPLVIAEIGINHNGSIKVAKEMVDSAHRAGAEVIKHQTHIIDDEMSSRAKGVVPGNSDISIYEIMSRCCLNEEDEFELKRYVENKGLIFISTPFSRAAVDRLIKMNIPAFKIGSGECNNYPLLKHIASFGKPVILSTGMNNLNSIKKAVEIFRDKNIPFALMHTTNLYPTPVHLVRLGAMVEMLKEFPDAPIGLSDHTTKNLACFGAVALGASILERHFTDHMQRTGPDIVNSMDERALSELIIGSKEIWQMRGGKKEAAQEEQVTIDFAFATIVSIKDIQKGERFTSDNLWVKRPGKGGIPAEHFENFIGKVASRDITIDEHLDWSDIEA